MKITALKNKSEEKKKSQNKQPTRYIFNKHSMCAEA